MILVTILAQGRVRPFVRHAKRDVHTSNLRMSAYHLRG